jgi:CheY-like chemotaxis protein
VIRNFIQEASDLAILISPCRPDFSVSAQDSNAGFTKDEMNRLICGDGKAFRLKTGELLLVDSLACSARADERNFSATCFLRNAIGDPGGEVCGNALLLGCEESILLSQSVQAALLPDRVAEAPVILLLDRNQGVRSVMAERLERDHFRVVQARTAIEGTEFCESHPIDLLVADVSSLRPKPMETLLSIRKAQSRAKVLLISGYDLSTVGFLYPGLLTDAEFLQKPFSLNVMADVAHWVGGPNKTQEQLGAMAHSQPDSEG